jgi:hypothetical protein
MEKTVGSSTERSESSTILRCSFAIVWSPENGSWMCGTIRYAICGQLRISSEPNTRPIRGKSRGLNYGHCSRMPRRTVLRCLAVKTTSRSPDKCDGRAELADIPVQRCKGRAVYSMKLGQTHRVACTMSEAIVAGVIALVGTTLGWVLNEVGVSRRYWTERRRRKHAEADARVFEAADAATRVA